MYKRKRDYSNYGGPTSGYGYSRSVRPRYQGYPRSTGYNRQRAPAASYGLRRAIGWAGAQPLRRRYTGVRSRYRGRPWTFREKVRDVTIRDAGIHTTQIVRSGAVNFDSGLRQLKAVECMTSLFVTQLSILSTGTSEKAMLRQASSRYVFSNGTNYPVRMSCYEVLCRKNCKNTIGTQLADGGPDQTVPMIDPTVGTSFRRYFKILSRSHQFIQSGQQAEIVCRVFYRSPKAITGDVEGNLEYPYPVGAKAILCYFEGVPSEDTSNLKIVNVPFGKVNWIACDAASFYYEEDNDPLMRVTNNLPIVTAGQTFKIYTDVGLVTEATDDP